MKARSPVFALVLVFLLAGTAYAQEMRTKNSTAVISFSGTTANCYVEIAGDSGSDKISATIEFNCGSQNIKTWTESTDHGHLMFLDSVGVTKGNTYELVVEYTINGKTQIPLSNSSTCK